MGAYRKESLGADTANVRRIPMFLVAAAVALVAAGEASAFECPATPIETRVAQADVVFVGRSTGWTVVGGADIPQRVYTFVVDQNVKGDLGATVKVRIPVRRANGGQVIPDDVAAGVLASRVGGLLFTTRCGITDPGTVLAEVDKPRGNAIKLLIGVVILASVLTYSIRRVRRRDPAASLRR